MAYMKQQVLLRVLLFCVLFSTFYGISMAGNDPAVQIVKKDPSSSSASDGSITLTITGNTGPYTVYFTSTSMPGKIFKESTVSLEGLKTGNYQFIIQDSHGHIINKSIELIGSR